MIAPTNVHTGKPLIAWSGQRVLITGASGFLGSHLIASLLKQSVEIIAVSRTRQDGRDPRVRWVTADLCDFGSVEHVLSSAKPSAIFHLSSLAHARRDLEAVRSTFESEVMATLNVLTAVARHPVQSLVLPGSLEEPDAGAPPTSPYSAAKASSRLYAEMFKALYDVPAVVPRIFMCYGPRQPDSKLIPSMIDALLRRQPPKIASPERKLDWVFAPDVAEGLVAASVVRSQPNQVIDLGTGCSITIQRLVETLRDLIQPDLELQYSETRPRLPEQSRVADADATEAISGWRAQTKLEDGLRMTVAAFQRERQLADTVSAKSDRPQIQIGSVAS